MTFENSYSDRISEFPLTVGLLRMGEQGPPQPTTRTCNPIVPDASVCV
jgi:hypothetical protein